MSYVNFPGQPPPGCVRVTRYCAMTMNEGDTIYIESYFLRHESGREYLPDDEARRVEGLLHAHQKTLGVKFSEKPDFNEYGWRGASAYPRAWTTVKVTEEVQS